MNEKRITIGVMGSAGNTLAPGDNQAAEDLARRLGTAIAKRNCVLFTGETNGLPGKVVEGAREAGGFTVGVSAAHTQEEHRDQYLLGAVGSDIVIYTGFGLKGRNVITVRSSDIVILISGSIGTLNEFTIAYDEGKVVGVLRGSGGVCDLVEELLAKLPKKTKSEVVYAEEVEPLLDRCIQTWMAREGL